MLMPEDKPEADIIMVATGTGIAPYRSFLRRLFTEETPARENFKGQAWLFLGVANSDSLLYDSEWQQILKDNPEKFRLDYALSREQKNKSGGKMYIQDKVWLRPADPRIGMSNRIVLSNLSRGSACTYCYEALMDSSGTPAWMVHEKTYLGLGCLPVFDMWAI